MNWIDQSVSEFGRSIGLPALALDADGALRLGTEAGGAIEVHHLRNLQPPAVLVMVSEPIGHNRAARLRAAMRLANWRRQQTLSLQVALDEDQLVLGARINERVFSQPVLESVLDELERLHQQISTAS